MPRVRTESSTLRRYRRADRISNEGILTMRPCAHYIASDPPILCVVSPLSEKCAQYHHLNRPYDLASPWDEFDRLQKQSDQLQAAALEAEAKAHRLRKQRRTLLKKLKALEDREERNIEEMEVDELIAGAAVSTEAPPIQVAFPGAISPTALSQVSFGSLNRTSPIPTGSS
jgi:hypothetical protein